ncbi:MAG: hybrid sensor histidine kinase/response regulator, partial [Comamonadaceae bacterium]
MLTPTFVIRGANQAYLEVTGRRLPDIVDRSIFDAFPTAESESALLLRESLQRVVRLKVRDALPLIRYGLFRDTPQGPVMEDRYWSATHTP